MRKKARTKSPMAHNTMVYYFKRNGGKWHVNRRQGGHYGKSGEQLIRFRLHRRDKLIMAGGSFCYSAKNTFDISSYFAP